MKYGLLKSSIRKFSSRYVRQKAQFTHYLPDDFKFSAPTGQAFTHRKHQTYGLQKVLHNLLNSFLHKIDGMNDHIAEDVCNFYFHNFPEKLRGCVNLDTFDFVQRIIGLRN